MYIHWKSLLEFGFIFWVLLCATDFLGDTRLQKKTTDFNIFYEESIMKEIVEQKVQSHINSIQKPSSLKFGWSLILWNSIVFFCSIIFCIVAKSITWFIFQIYAVDKKRHELMEIEAKRSSFPERQSSSRIPVLMYKTAATVRASDTNIKMKTANVNTDVSCPNLQRLKLSSSVDAKINVRPPCEMIFKNDLFATNLNNTSMSKWQSHCAKLREEIVKSQASSLREHANLSRKLEAISKEKKELSKQLAVAHKENRAAKQQLEELLQEKTLLLKRLENATNEFRVNTKTKKIALAKLDEVSGNVENLKLQLEQVSRDKEILENKFRLLEDEYLKLQDRLIDYRNHESVTHSENTPERDSNMEMKIIRMDVENHFNAFEPSGDNSLNNCPSIPQAELDMKKIQSKIKQLEKSLENFNMHKMDLTTNLSVNPSIESDISLSLLGNNTDSQYKTDDYTETTDRDSPRSSPRFFSWTGRAGDMMQNIANRVNEKVRLLEKRGEHPSREINCCSTSEISDPEPRRIVSSSRAFQNFLKGLNSDSSRISNSTKGLIQDKLY